MGIAKLLATALWTMLAILPGCSGTTVLSTAKKPLPDKIGIFELAEQPLKGRSSITAAYQAMFEAGPVIATIQRRSVQMQTSLLPSLDIGKADPDQASRAALGLSRSLDQIRRFYPQAEAKPGRTFLVMREGSMHPARHMVVTYLEEIDGISTTVRLDVHVMCCSRMQELIEIRFRQTGGEVPELEENEFLRNVPWGLADYPS